MALIDYGSSDEEDQAVDEVKVGDVKVFPAQTSHSASVVQPETQSNGSINPKKGIITEAASDAQHLQPDAPLVGPVQGPTIPTVDTDLGGLLDEYQGDGDAPQSPYSANRALLRNLTLPSIPNYDIPPSPPGSPVASTNAKFKHFLDLKKKGVHFNEKISKSAALKNPSLMQKLMDFSNIDEISQYSTTLPKDLWDPSAFTESAFKEELARSQKKILKRKEEEKSRGQREHLDFVAATVSSEPSSRTGTPGARGGQKSAAERIMAGLDSDRGRSNSPQVQGTKRKSRFDS